MFHHGERHVQKAQCWEKLKVKAVQKPCAISAFEGGETCNLLPLGGDSDG